MRYARRRLGLRVADHQGLAGRAASAVFGGGYFILVDYPPSADSSPRYGYGRPPHRRLSEILGRGDDSYRTLLEELGTYRNDLLEIPLDKTDPREPHWRNGLLFGLDGVSLYGLARQREPRRYIEVGSGNSTLFIDRARRDGRIEMEITSIDPFPRREIDAICDRVVREPLESTDLAIFGALEAGDMVFFDGSHRVFMNSDAAVFYLDVLPELPPGVLVGIHDIHLPDDYRPEHAERYYSEQYLLASYLLGEASWIRPVLPCWYVSHHPELGDLARSLIPKPFLEAPTRPPYPPPRHGSHGLICWLMTERRA
jgi:predicted O-methyltransferase YrrM